MDEYSSASMPLVLVRFAGLRPKDRRQLRSEDGVVPAADQGGGVAFGSLPTGAAHCASLVWVTLAFARG